MEQELVDGHVVACVRRLDSRLYWVRVAALGGAGALVHHVRASHELRSEVPALATRAVQVELKLGIALAQVGLVRAKDDRPLTVVRAREAEHGVVDRRLEVCVLCVDHEAHTLALCALSDLVQPCEHPLKRRTLVAIEGRMI